MAGIKQQHSIVGRESFYSIFASRSPGCRKQGRARATDARKPRDMSADPEREEEEGRGAPATSRSGEGEGDVQASDDSSEASMPDGWTKEPGDRADAGGAYATLTRYLRRKPGASPRKASTLGNYFRRKPDGGDPSAPQRPGFWHWFGWAPKKPAPKSDGGARQ